MPFFGKTTQADINFLIPNLGYLEFFKFTDLKMNEASIKNKKTCQKTGFNIVKKDFLMLRKISLLL
jgi:hypothetical protein